MDRETELALVAGLRAGEAAAFDAVYDAYRARLYGFLARLSRRRDVAEDLVEETWLRLVASAGRLAPDTRLGPWLFTVARNLYFSACRSRLLEETLTSGLIDLWPVGGRQPSPFEAAAAGELERRLERALAALPPAAREVLLLVGVEGLTPAEAAAVCGVTPDALRQRLSRARGQLARELETTGAAPVPALQEALT
jgi:RNA polymerase sigma-70 factor (ECF subfamily)